MILTSLGILFDIDGVLTLPITEKRKISVIDPELIEYLSNIHQQGIKFSLITGRAYPWVNTFLLSKFESFLEDIPIYMEYGLTSLKNGAFKVSKKAKSFRDEFFSPILSSIKQNCQEKNIIFELKPYIDYPEHGSLWLEDKKVMISIASNASISTETVQDMVIKSCQDYLDNIRIVKHHLGCDILPKGWSKEQAAIEAYQLLDPEKKIDQWYVFGDNESDKEMCRPFRKATFIDAKIGASETTKDSLKKIVANN